MNKTLSGLLVLACLASPGQHAVAERLDNLTLEQSLRIAHEHHEHFDGNGYPRGLKGEAISIEGRILAIADVLDALGHKRVYKEAWDDLTIRNYFRAQRGSQFDPGLIDILFAHWDEVRAIRERFRDD